MSEDQADLVTVTVDGKEVRVPKGTNLIEVARQAGVEIPHYCYHPNLSIAGNCRMCQVEVEGMPKLTIGCNTMASDGMVVKTQESSEQVADAQRATLEFLLINHPLDCTVCDQAGHCKLQDYYYEYNGKASRFVAEKVNKIKAEPVGPEVIYDGERCIVCTRCVRFCDEVTETSEFGVFNRGDKSVIGIHPGKELDNPFSGNVVDLCPVGALTHRQWRFNTRIWYTKEADTICTGCSTGCNAKVAVRDDQIVQVKARENQEVNKDWLCDEGRYGFDRFQPKERLTSCLRRDGDTQVASDFASVAAEAKALKSNDSDALVFISPFLTLEEMWLAVRFSEDVMGVSAASAACVVQARPRTLTELEKILISPDYAPNMRAAQLLGLCEPGDNWREALSAKYTAALESLRSGAAKRVALLGYRAIAPEDCSDELCASLADADVSLCINPEAPSSNALVAASSLVIPGRTVHEKNGVMLNRDGRLQRLHMLLQAPVGSQPDWLAISSLAKELGKQIVGKDVRDERSLFRSIVSGVEVLSGLTLMQIGDDGIALSDVPKIKSAGAEITSS